MINPIKYGMELMKLPVKNGIYEVRKIDENKKVIDIKYIDTCYECAGYMFDESNEWDYLISPNPVSEKELWDNPYFTKDERKISKIDRLVLDVDYPYDEYIDKVLNTLIGVFEIEKECISVLRSPSGNIRIVILFDTRGFKSVEDSIKVAKVLNIKINEVFKGIGFELDRTFLTNIGHMVFVEERFVNLKDSRRSEFVSKASKRFDLAKYIDFMKEFEDIFSKFKSKGSSGNNKKSSSKVSKNKVSKKRVNKLEEVRKALRIDEEYVEYVVNSLLENDKKYLIGVYKYGKKDERFNKKSWYKELSNYYANLYEGESLTVLDNPYKRDTFLWKYIRSKLPEFVDDTIVDLEYVRKVYSYVREINANMRRYDKTLSGRSKAKNRFQTNILPYMQLLVSCFGKKFLVEQKLYVNAVEYMLFNNTKEKQELIQDLYLALYSIDEGEDYLRKNDIVFLNYFSYKRIPSHIYIAQFFKDAQKKKIYTKKDIVSMYNLSDRQYRTFLSKLKDYHNTDNIDISTEGRKIIMNSFNNEFQVYRLTFKHKIYWGKFFTNIHQIYYSMEKKAMKKRAKYRIFWKRSQIEAFRNELIEERIEKEISNTDVMQYHQIHDTLKEQGYKSDFRRSEAINNVCDGIREIYNLKWEDKIPKPIITYVIQELKDFDLTKKLNSKAKEKIKEAINTCNLKEKEYIVRSESHSLPPKDDFHTPTDTNFNPYHI